MEGNNNDWGGRTTVEYAPVKQKKSLSGGMIALLIVICILVSSVFGFGGAMAANYFLVGKAESQPESGGALTDTSSANTATTNVVVSDITKVVEEVSDSVVEITTEAMQTGGFFSQYVVTGAGSGVIISDDGFIVTCAHVVSGASNVKVMLSNGDEYVAEVMGSDSVSDIAVIKIDAKGLTKAEFGNSDSLMVGEPAIAIGNPLGSLGGTVTSGIISATEREVTVGNQSMKLLQTNAAINPGNSGGGLFDANGKLIGIVNAKSSGNSIEGLGFAIPGNAANEVAASIMENGYVTGRPALGISVVEALDTQTAVDQNVDRLGVYVYDVTVGSGADKAGMKTGDYIVSINDEAISRISDISVVLTKCSVGDVVSVQIIRDNKVMTLDVTLSEMSAS